MGTRTNRFPTINKLRAGSSPTTIKQDILGILSLRVDEARSGTGEVEKGGPGGTPYTRNERDFVPNLLKAAHQLGLPPKDATSPEVLEKVKRLGSVPQQMSKTLGTSDPIAQAVQILKGRG